MTREDPTQAVAFRAVTDVGGVTHLVSDAQVAVLLRHAQRALDDAAHEVPAGRATAGQRVELAATLQALALALRAAASSADPSPVRGDGGRGPARG